MKQPCPVTPQKINKISPLTKDSFLTPSSSRKKSKFTERSTPSGEEKDSVKANLFETVSPFKRTGKELSEETKRVYKIIQKATGETGGNGDTGAIYGELTIGSMDRVLEFMAEHCELNTQSIFMDVGCGLMKPNAHAAQYPGVRLSVGIELEEIRYKLAMINLKSLLRDETINHNTHCMLGDIDIATTLDPITHCYMYDLGFPPPLQQSIARKFNTSQHCQYLVSYRPPRRVIDEYGYAVTFIDSVPTSMTGSGEGHTCYFYKRANTPPVLSAKETRNGTASSMILTLSPRPNHPEDPAEDRKMFCDNAFYDMCRLAAVVDRTELVAYVNAAVAEHHSPVRSLRSGKRVASY